MVLCSVYKCKNSQYKVKKYKQKISFHRFPSDTAMKDLWIKSLGWRATDVSPKDLICTAHFEDKYIDKTSLCNIRLKRNAIPTIYEKHAGFRKKIVKDRRPPVYTRYNRRNRKRSLSSLADMSALFPDVSVQSESDAEFRPTTSLTSTRSQPPILRRNFDPDDSDYNDDDMSSVNESSSSHTLAQPIVNSINEPLCAIQGCYSKQSDSKDGITLHRYPREISMRNVWRRALKGKTHSTSNVDVVCSKHFEAKYIDTSCGNSGAKLIPTAIPTIFPNAENSSVFRLKRRDYVDLPKAAAPLNFAKGFSEKIIKIKAEKDSNSSENVVKQTEKIKMLRDKIKRKNQKIELLKEFIKIYERKMKPKESGVLFSGIPSDFFHQQIDKLTTSSKNTTKFAEELEKFSTNLYSISPSAYNYVREAFDYVLPSSKKIKTKEEPNADGENDIMSLEGDHDDEPEDPDDDFDDDYDEDDDDEDDYSFDDEDDDVIIQEDEIDNIILIDDS